MFMRSLSLILVLFFVSSCTKQGTQCTSEPQEKWQEQEGFKQNLLSQGYKIKVFKVTKGKCYEIYGWDKEGQKVEVYFNPVDGAVVKKEIED